MHRFFADERGVVQGAAYLNAEDAGHALRVLRLESGDEDVYKRQGQGGCGLSPFPNINQSNFFPNFFSIETGGHIYEQDYR